MKRPDRHRQNRLATQKSHGLLPALVAVSGAFGLATTSVNALELGDVRVESTLGQPLRASIAYALNANEQLFDFCIYLRPGPVDAAIPAITLARVTITNSTIILTGNTPIKDPLVSMQVAVDCPYTPNLSRQYTMIVDPIRTEAIARFAAVTERSDAAAPAQQTTSTERQARPAAASAPALTGMAMLNETPIGTEAEYLVRTGDSISAIVSRIENRTIGLWPAIGVIVTANPGAFINGDPSRLMAGSVLNIPDLTGAPIAPELPAEQKVAYAPQQIALAASEFFEPDVVVDHRDPAQQPAVAASVATVALPTDSARESAPGEPVNVVEQTTVDATVAAEKAVSENTEDASAIANNGLRSGDIISSAESADIGNIVAAPANNGASPPTSGARSWLIWLGGSGLAIISGFLLFGRQFRKNVGAVAIGKSQESAAPAEEAPRQTNPVITDVDFQFEGILPSVATSLDADLDAGTGLRDSSVIDVAQDFGFTASNQVDSEIDHDFTEETARETEEEPTDMIPANHAEETSFILRAETGSKDEDYDLSMIIDATRQSINESDATAKDLHAVQIDAPVKDEYDVVSDNTLNQDADLQILEQDYEDELTATQALNIEIEKAAAELVDNMDENESALPSEALALEPTAEMPVRSSGPATGAGLTATIAANIDAVNDDNAIEDDPDITSKLAAAGSDITLKMQVECGKVDTQKKS